jgi:hypothetical protein
MLAILAFRRQRVDAGGTRSRCVSGGDGLRLTGIAFALVMLLGATYRRWLGYA